ncbi:TIGR00730 family Rossman fold protein [Lactobacillus sp. LC28-10]|uniref:Cytokinin riboside 5'-monophosphate phosphoribohydrolase n=1 Tax=Secundilactobacillus angelensis TaxID=2722706 RepID=A0ABX1L043_9LACO|nr:TIGR00730 family Rossman fold protein [Secundilactobacillus angelensis]MCH5462677.1 TIGR00730 family Rossman fold protein [Secundilactobacillus angelensis]NLR18789.1 TIGR00730 family Rossman fold protein [Secundilactobacillus angelensis]
MLKKIAVYCGANLGHSPVYRQSATELGQYLAEHSLELVYGGGNVGLMGILADTVIDAGGKAHGVMPKNLVDRGAAATNITDLTVVDNMSLRKQQMLDMADGCIALPGGPGTLEEIVEAYSWARIGDNPNPCAFYNVNHYYDPLVSFFNQMVQQQFLTPEHRSKLLFADNLPEIFQFMADYTPPTIRTNYQN